MDSLIDPNVSFFIHDYSFNTVRIIWKEVVPWNQSYFITERNFVETDWSECFLNMHNGRSATQ